MFIDIEGAELHAIESAKKLLKNSPNCIILLEWTPKFTEALNTDVAGFLQDKSKKNYKFYQITLPPETEEYKEISIQELLNIEQCDIIIVPPAINSKDIIKL